VNQSLITIDVALHALASATMPDELATLANRVEALRAYARRAKLGLIAENRCVDIRVHAERKLGEILKTTPGGWLHGRSKKVFRSMSVLRSKT